MSTSIPEAARDAVKEGIVYAITTCRVSAAVETAVRNHADQAGLVDSIATDLIAQYGFAPIAAVPGWLNAHLGRAPERYL